MKVTSSPKFENRRYRLFLKFYEDHFALCFRSIGQTVAEIFVLGEKVTFTLRWNFQSRKNQGKGTYRNYHRPMKSKLNLVP